MIPLALLLLLIIGAVDGLKELKKNQCRRYNCGLPDFWLDKNFPSWNELVCGLGSILLLTATILLLKLSHIDTMRLLLAYMMLGMSGGESLIYWLVYVPLYSDMKGVAFRLPKNMFWLNTWSLPLLKIVRWKIQEKSKYKTWRETVVYSVFIWTIVAVIIDFILMRVL